MANIYTIRNLPKTVRVQLRAFARARNLKMGEAMAYLLRRGLEAADEKKPYTLRDLGKLAFKGRKDESMRVDEVVYAARRQRHVLA